MGKIVLTDAEMAVLKKCERAALALSSLGDMDIKQAEIAVLSRDFSYLVTERFTRLADAILHGYKERRFRLRLWGVVDRRCYVNITPHNEIVIQSADCARTFTKTDLDNSYDLERLADGCVKEYANGYE